MPRIKPPPLLVLRGIVVVLRRKVRELPNDRPPNLDRASAQFGDKEKSIRVMAHKIKIIGKSLALIARIVFSEFMN